MAEYIDKDEVHKRLTLLEMKLIEEEGYYHRFTKGFGECMWHVANFPPADVVSRETYEAVQKALQAFAETDVVQVVRCENCAFANKQVEFKNLYVCLQNERFVKKNDFCSNGVRRTDNE